jgi:hypothetical protein
VPHSPRRGCRSCPTGVAAADSDGRPRPPRSPTPEDDESTRRHSCRSLPRRSTPPHPTTPTTRRALRSRRGLSRTTRCQRGRRVHRARPRRAHRGACRRHP